MRAILDLTKPTQQGIQQFLDVLLNSLGFIAVVALVAKFGFYLDPKLSQFVYSSSRILMWLFVGQELVRYLIVPGVFRQLRLRWLETSVAFITFLYLLFSSPVQSLVHAVLPGARIADITLIYLGLTQFLVLVTQILRSFRDNSVFASIKLHPSRLFLLSYMLTIFVATLLLKLPRATTESISWLDALFTATSAVCVTGLMTIDIATVLSPLGQGMVCLMIQVGGLGIMTFTMTFALFLSGGLGVLDRMFLADLVSEERLGEVGRLLAQIIVFTLTIEFFGAVGLYYAQGGTFGNFHLQSFAYAVFHSVSAFCNAGISLFTAGFADSSVHENKSFTSSIMVLIVIGGLGFPVLRNFYDISRGRRPKVKNLFLTVSTKLILASTLVLLVAGTLLVWLAESSRAFVHLGLWDQLYQSLFWSVTARTAGFNIWPTETLGVSATIVVMILMWIGGSPMSTAGGVKNLTVMVALFNVRSVLTGTPIQIFGRQISARSVNRAYAVVTLSILGFMAAALVLITLEPHLPVDDLMFEALSALGTVGLSRGVTAHLSEPSKLLIIIAMLVGRIGLLTFFVGFMQQHRETKYKVPDENIPIV